jgi:hypothetical protein
MSLQDEYIRITIHPSELDRIQKTPNSLFAELIGPFVDEYADIEFFPKGKKNGKPINKIKEFKKALKELVKVRKENKGKQSNIECLVYDKLFELLHRMDLKQLRKLNLEKLI